MSQDKTLVLREDEERTLIDARTLCARSPGHSAIRRASLLMRSAWPVALSLGAPLFVAAFFATAAFFQHQELQSLRRIVREASQKPSNTTSAQVVTTAPDSSEQPRAARPTTTPDRALVEREASTLLLTKRYPNALVQYRLLAEYFPDESTYPDFVTVLETKMGCGTTGGVCP